MRRGNRTDAGEVIMHSYLLRDERAHILLNDGREQTHKLAGEEATETISTTF